MKTKKSFFIFLITLMYFMGSFFIFTAAANELLEENDYHEHFEDDTINAQGSELAFGEAFINTYNEGPDSKITAMPAASPFGGSKCYRFAQTINEYAHVNFTYNSTFNIDYLNFTLFAEDTGTQTGAYYRYITFRVDDGAGGLVAYLRLRWYNTEGAAPGNEPRFQYMNSASSWVTWFTITTDYNANVFSMYLHFESNDTYDLTAYHHDGNTYYYLNDTLTGGVTADEYPVLHSIYTWDTAVSFGAWIDDIRVDFGYPVLYGGGQSRIYFEFFEDQTNQRLRMFGYGFTGAVDDPYEGRALLETDFTPFGYKYTETWGYTLEIIGTFDPGSYHYINFTNIIVNYPGDESSFMSNINGYYHLYDNQTYTVWFTPVSLHSGFNNSKTRQLPGGLEVSVRTNKQIYSSGENVLIQYKLPTHTELMNAGLDSAGWELWVYDDADRFGWPVPLWETDGGDGAALKVTGLIYDNQYHTVSHVFPATTTRVVQYKIYIGMKWFLIDKFLLQDPLRFYVEPTGGAYTPSGNITSVSPDPPYIGQLVTITVEANNYGQLEYRRIDENENHRIQRFDTIIGTLDINFTFWEFGYYRLSLHVSDGYEFIETDYYYFWVNDTDNTPGGYGYNIEYLQAEPYRAIAGFDTVYIQYRTLVNDTEIMIKDGRGQTTIYSTQVDAGYGVHSFKLPNWANIGRWNVTMSATGTLYTEFFVIADENNYAEFSRNTYYDTEQFEVYIRHDQPVIIAFKHNNDPVGQDLYLDSGQHVNGIMTIDKVFADPAPGNWTLEMYSSNDRIKRKLLARDYCEVIYNDAARQQQYREEGYDSIIGMIAMAAPLFGGGEAGFWFLSLFIIIGSIAFILYMGGKTVKNDTIILVLILETLCLTMIGWLPFWVAIVAIVIAAFSVGPAFSKKMGFGSG
jgi:hypothetical protein